MSAAENFRAIMTEIGEEIILVAVTKNHGVELMREVIDAGAKHIGENRVQEAAEKFQTLNREVTRHLIGHLQTNKVKAAVKLFDVIQSVDSRILFGREAFLPVFVSRANFFYVVGRIKFQAEHLKNISFSQTQPSLNAFVEDIIRKSSFKQDVFYCRD